MVSNDEGYGKCYHRMQCCLLLFSILLHFIVLFILLYCRHGEIQHQASSTHLNTTTAPELPTLLFTDNEESWASTHVALGPHSVFETDGEIASIALAKQLPEAATAKQASEEIQEENQPPSSDNPEQRTAHAQTTDHSTMKHVHAAPAVQSPEMSTISHIETPTLLPTSSQKTIPVNVKRITRAGSISPRAQKIMSRIASSFIHAAKDEQAHCISIIGDSNRMPTADQIKKERYLARLQQCLQVSLTTMRPHMPSIREQVTDTLISLKLHRDGSVSEIVIKRGSNYPALDQFYIAAFLDASHSFPPLPSYFSLDFYTIQWIVHTL
jgi:outer membrane biosynthesis protein TonB